MTAINITELTAAVDLVNAADAGQPVPPGELAAARHTITTAADEWALEPAVHLAVAILAIEQASGITDPADQPD